MFAVSQNPADRVSSGDPAPSVAKRVKKHSIEDMEVAASPSQENPGVPWPRWNDCSPSKRWKLLRGELLTVWLEGVSERDTLVTV